MTGGLLFRFGLRNHQRKPDGSPNAHRDESEGPGNRKLALKEIIEPQHLEADKNQHGCQPILQEMKLVDRSREQKVQRTKAENREDIRREDDQWLFGDSKNGWNRVDRKKNVRELEKY